MGRLGGLGEAPLLRHHVKGAKLRQVHIGAPYMKHFYYLFAL